MSRDGRVRNSFIKARAKGVAGVAGLVATGLVIATLPGLAATSAAWNDYEWVSATQGTAPGIGTGDCEVMTDFIARGDGQFLSGNVFGLNLATVAEANGVEVETDSNITTVDPGSAQSLGNGAYANPLDVSALTAINLALTGLLQFPLNQDLGALNQYGQALNSGVQAGAAGLVNNSGAIATTTEPPPAELPTSAEFDLGELFTDLGLPGLTNITDMGLRLGAVASSATLNACEADWDDAIYANLVRAYLIADLELDIDSPLVAGLVSAVNATTATIDTSLDTLAGSAGLLNALTGLVTDELGPVLTALTLGTPTATVTLDADFSAVTNLLDDTISDAGGIISIDLADGSITVDIAELFDSADGLNTEAPNTQLLINDIMINALLSAIASALADWVEDIQDAINDALDILSVDVDVTVPVSLPFPLGSVGNLVVDVDATLASLIDGSAPLGVNFNCSLAPVACVGVNAVVDPALPLIDAVVEDQIVQGIGGIVDTAADLVTGPLVTTLISTTLPGITAPIVSLLGNSLDFLFGENRLLSITVNAQNAPDPSQAGIPIGDYPEPAWAAGLDDPAVAPFRTGQYDVSALRLVVAGAVAAGIGLDFARSSVGTSGPTP